MTAARLTVVFYVAAVAALAAALALSWPPAHAPPPRLQISWSVGPRPNTSAAARRSTQFQTKAPPLSPAGAQAASSVQAGGAELGRVKARLESRLNRELYADFRLFLYVSKAAKGPFAQRMYVFRKSEHGALSLLYRWPVSTGREKTEVSPSGERVSTRTPTGYFEIDPKRLYRHHVSTSWHKPMPYAMFLDWRAQGRPTGIAIHAASGRGVATLGMRASAGCIRLEPDAARTLYSLIRTQYRGWVPRFAVDNAGTMTRDGIVLQDRGGHAKMAEGYRVLLIIANDGGRDIVGTIN